MRLILFGGFFFGQNLKKYGKKRPFFRATTAGLGTYHTGGYGRIGVHRVKDQGPQTVWGVARAKL